MAAPNLDTLPVTLHQTALRKILSFLGCAAFVAGGYWLTTLEDTGRRRGFTAEEAGWLAIAVFGFFCLLIVIGMLRGRPTLTLAREGFTVAPLVTPPYSIGWHEVEAIGTNRVSSNTFVAFLLTAEARAARRDTGSMLDVALDKLTNRLSLLPPMNVPAEQLAMRMEIARQEALFSSNQP